MLLDTAAPYAPGYNEQHLSCGGMCADFTCADFTFCMSMDESQSNCQAYKYRGLSHHHPHTGHVQCVGHAVFTLASLVSFCVYVHTQSRGLQVRYMSGVRSKADFKYAATAASSIMTACFLVMGAVGYLQLGTHFDQSQPITSVLPQDAWTPVMNGGLLAHCILAYQVRAGVCVAVHTHARARMCLKCVDVCLCVCVCARARTCARVHV